MGVEVWVAFTLMAALVQTVRTAAQKRLSGVLSPMATTMVRYVYGLPFVGPYVFYLGKDQQVAELIPALGSAGFLANASIAAIAQILATYW